MRKWLRCALGLMLMVAGVEAAEVKLAVEPAAVQPGDLVTVTARLTSLEYASLAFDLPPDPQFRLISAERGVLEWKGTQYVQEHRWVLQPKYSDEWRVADLTAEVIFKDRRETLPVNELLLTVRILDEEAEHADSKTDLSLEPMAWPSATRAPRGARWIGVVLVSLLLVVVVGLFFRRQQQRA